MSISQTLRRLKNPKVKINHPFKRKVNINDLITNTQLIFDSISEAAEFLGVNINTIYNYHYSDNKYKILKKKYLITILD